MKNRRNVYIILAVLLVVLSVIAFAIPFTKNALFFTGYICGVAAIAFQIYVFHIAFKDGEDAKSRFYGFPIARIGVIYLGTQLVLSLIEMGLAAYLPLWVGLVINVILLGAAVIGCIAAETTREEIKVQEQRVKTDVNNMRSLQSISASLVGICSDATLKKSLQDLAEKFRYSDPVSSEQTKPLEEDIKTQIENLKNTLIENDAEGAEQLIKKVILCLEERNRVCKESK